MRRRSTSTRIRSFFLPYSRWRAAPDSVHNYREGSAPLAAPGYCRDERHRRTMPVCSGSTTARPDEGRKCPRCLHRLTIQETTVRAI